MVDAAALLSTELPAAPTAPAPAVALPHLVRWTFDRTELRRSFGRRFVAADGACDLGYLVHCRLVALLGDFAPGAFHVRETGTRVEAVAWSQRDALSLQRLAEGRGPRTRRRTFVDAPWWSASHSGEAAWRAGGRFVVRLCPVVRRSRDGAELDAFAHAAAAGSAADRAAVYIRWTRGRFEAAGLVAADLRLESWTLTRLLRRRQGPSRERRPRWLRRPEAVVSGRLLEPDRASLARLLVHGLGRHRAFGFGMVRPVTTSPGDPR